MSKVLVISNMYPSEKFPFYGTFVHKITHGLEVNGAQCSLVVLKKVSNNFFIKFLHYLFFYFKAFLLCSFVNYDRIYIHFPSHCYIPVALSRFFRETPVVINFHGGDAFLQPGRSKIFHSIKEFVNKKACRKAFRVVVPSYSFAKALTASFEIEKNKLVVSPSGGVDVDFFCNTSKSRDTPIKLLYVARMVHVKRPILFSQLVISLIKECVPVEVTIVGSGPLKKSVLNALRGVKVNFFDSVSQSDLVKILNDNHLLVQTSESESLGLVTLEAMATSCIPVCIDIPAYREIISQGENGFIFKNETEFLSIIKNWFYMEEGIKKEISLNARKTVLKNYSSNVVLKRLYDEIM